MKQKLEARKGLLYNIVWIILLLYIKILHYNMFGFLINNVHVTCVQTVLEVLKTNTCCPDCTWEYCQSNPNEICSARWSQRLNFRWSLHFNLISVPLSLAFNLWYFCRSVSMEKRECGGHCQHTTCSSCLLLKPPSCPQSCSPTDHVCLHRFGRCVRGHVAEEKHPPICHQNLKVSFLCNINSLSSVFNHYENVYYY